MRPPREVRRDHRESAGRRSLPARAVLSTPRPAGRRPGTPLRRGRSPRTPARRAVPTVAGATLGAHAAGTTSSGGAVAHTETDPVGRSALRKVAWRLMPFLGVLYFVNYLDRTNIGFAKL